MGKGHLSCQHQVAVRLPDRVDFYKVSFRKSRRPYIGFGSKADIVTSSRDVCLPPKADIREIAN
jgi:hypothetical protein